MLGPDLRRSFRWLLVTVLLGWLLFSWFQVAQVLVRDYVNLPIWDYWRTAENYERYRAYDFSVLWKQHNEHRIVFPEILFATDMLFMHGRQVLPLVLSFLFYLGNWVVLGCAFISCRRGDAFPRVVAVLAAGIIIGSKASSQLLNTPFLLQWTLVQLASLLTFFFVSKLADTSRHRYLAATIVCAVVANYSSGNGLLLWPIVLFAAFAAGVHWRNVAFLGMAALASIGLYFVGYHASKDVSLLAIIHDPLYALGFLSSYLSMPFAYGIPAAGLLNLCCFLALVMVVTHHRLWRARPVIVYFGSYLFTLATIFITMAGRMNPDDPTYTAAMATRYVTVPLVNWAVLLLAALWISIKLEWEIFSWWKIAVPVLALLLLAAPRVGRWVAGDEVIIMEQQAAALSIESGLLAPELVRKVYPDLHLVAICLPVLRRNHLALFSQPTPTWIGKAAKTTFRVSDSKVETGMVSNMIPITSGLEVTGWADSLNRHGHIVFLNDNDQVVGLAERTSAGVPPELRPTGQSSKLGWVGFIDRTFASFSYHAFIVHNEKDDPELFPLGESFNAPTVTMQDVSTMGIAMPALHWSEHNGWTENILPSIIDAGDSHSASFLSSWNGGDQSTGMASSSLFPVSNGCFVLPVLHGPSVNALSVHLLDQRDREVATIPMIAGRLQWQLFRIETTAPLVRIAAEDSGRGWGEWQAVGQPLRCK